MGIISWLILGLIAGWLAGQFMKGGGYGMVGDIILGIIGAFVGGFLASAIFKVDAVNGFDPVSIIVAFIGACIVIAISRAISPNRSAV